MKPSDPANNSLSALDAPVYEAQHVHAVYEQIATHFSTTRYKPWPVVTRFLSSCPAGSVGLDSGCGNGKYLGLNPDVYLIGSDYSSELTAIARHRTIGHGLGESFSKSDSGVGAVITSADACMADSLVLPHPTGRFDFAISVAVVHHFATRARRIGAIAALLDVVRPQLAVSPSAGPESHRCSPELSPSGNNGKVLICVWALEQRNSRRGWDRGMQQDVLVPWVTKTDQKGEECPTNEKTFQRYYHLYREGELEEDVLAAGGTVMDHGYEADNWWVVAKRMIY